MLGVTELRAHTVSVQNTIHDRKGILSREGSTVTDIVGRKRSSQNFKILIFFFLDYLMLSSVGLLICSNTENIVVEYQLSLVILSLSEVLTATQH